MQDISSTHLNFSRHLGCSSRHIKGGVLRIACPMSCKCRLTFCRREGMSWHKCVEEHGVLHICLELLQVCLEILQSVLSLCRERQYPVIFKTYRQDISDMSWRTWYVLTALSRHIGLVVHDIYLCLEDMSWEKKGFPMYKKSVRSQNKGTGPVKRTGCRITP